jgi:protein-S-isoprenylcysteine O-methyltransferase Ste14
MMAGLAAAQIAGIGLATGFALSFLICLALPLIGIVSRISAEEATLSAVLPAENPAYAAGTKRLVPFVW